MNEIKESHESYAMASFSRVTSSENHNLFGSSITHNNTITLTICQGERHRDLHREHFFPRNKLIEVEMSQNQFSELITSLNMGSGIPVTLRHLGGVRKEDPPYHNQRHLFENEFKKDIQDVGKKLSAVAQELETMLEEKAPKRVFKEFVHKLRMVAQHINSNLPFVQKQFNEAMDKTVTEAKSEVESFVFNRVTSLGIEGLKTNLLELEGNDHTKEKLEN